MHDYFTTTTTTRTTRTTRTTKAGKEKDKQDETEHNYARDKVEGAKKPKSRMYTIAETKETQAWLQQMEIWLKGDQKENAPDVPAHVKKRLKKHGIVLDTPDKVNTFCLTNSFVRVMAAFSIELEDSAAEQALVGACMSYYIAVLCEAMLSEACTDKQRLSKKYQHWLRILVLAYEMTAFESNGHVQAKGMWGKMANTEELREARKLLGSRVGQSKDDIPDYKMFGFLLWIPRLVQLKVLDGIPQDILDKMVEFTTNR